VAVVCGGAQVARAASWGHSFERGVPRRGGPPCRLRRRRGRPRAFRRSARRRRRITGQDL